MKKLSIIIPVYNVAAYLRKCVDSVLTQDFSDYEIILVDDGSTDGSGAICDEYAYSRLSPLDSPLIRVIHQANMGLSAARNAGLKAAKGEYVCFVDSDDYWEENVLGGLMEQVEREELDVLRFDYQNVRLRTENDGMSRTDVLNEPHTLNDIRYEVFEPNKQPHQIDRQSEVVDGETYLNTRMGYACYAVMYIVRRNLLIYNLSFVIGDLNKEDCLFTEGIHFEDVEWMPRMMLRAKRVNSTATIVYNYLVRQGSITKTQGEKEKIRRNVEDQMYVLNQYKMYREQYPTCNWLWNMQSSMAVGVLTTVAREFYDEQSAYIMHMRDVKALPLAIANQGKTYTRRAVLINLFGPRAYCAIMHLR